MLMIELYKIKNELAPPIMNSTLREVLLIISEICKSFSQNERKRCMI